MNWKNGYAAFAAKQEIVKSYKMSYEKTMKKLGKDRYDNPRNEIIYAEIDNVFRENGLKDKPYNFELQQLSPSIENLYKFISEEISRFENFAIINAATSVGVFKFKILSDGDSQCAYCKKMDGYIFSVLDKQEIPPFHPNCDCKVSLASNDYYSEKTLNTYAHMGIRNDDYKAFLMNIISKDDLLKIARATAYYDGSKMYNMYSSMNFAYLQLVEVREKYNKNYGASNEFDFTHGGKYDSSALSFDVSPYPSMFQLPNSLYSVAHLDIITDSKNIIPEKHNEWTNLRSFVWWSDFTVNGGKDEKIEPFKDQWVHGNKAAIKVAAKKFNIPEILLAGVVHNEVGGDPPFLDDGGYLGRSGMNALGIPSKNKDRTSFGDTSVQVLTAAETLGYNLGNLTQEEKFSIITSLKDNTQGIFITAMHLSQLRDYDFKGKDSDDLTDDELSVIASRYNRGKSETAEEIVREYGDKILNRKEKLKVLLKDK